VAKHLSAHASETLRTVLKSPSGPESYQFKSIAERLVEARQKLSEVEANRVLPTRRLGGSTTKFYEDKLEAVRELIEQPSIGILSYIKDLANETFKRPSETSLYLLYEIRGRCLIIRRRVVALERPIVGFALSWKPAVLLLVLALLIGPAIYATRAAEARKTPVGEAVKVQLITDRQNVAKALNEPGKSNIERGKGALEQLSNAISIVPKALTGCSLLLALIQYIFIKQRWRQRSLDGLRDDLAIAAETFKNWASGK
jgi:hypothetical protein